MMYWGFPEVSQRERLSKAEVLTPAAIRISPGTAYSSLGWDLPPEDVRVVMMDGRPVYRFQSGRNQSVVYADTGDRLISVSQATALHVAAQWTGHSAIDAHFDGSLHKADQWTVSGEYNALRPLLKFSWPDGQQVYVSEQNGEVVQHTTRRTRLAAYLGAIPHWLYWTPLRENANRWYKIVVFLSALATGGSFLGLVIGCWMYSPNRRYKFRNRASRIPYSGSKRWHMVLGLVFGAVACTWSFSGLLSLGPFDSLAGRNEPPVDVNAALRGKPIRLDAFASKSPAAAIEEAAHQAKELDLLYFNGAPHYLARQSPEVSSIIPVHGNSSEQFDAARVISLVSKNAPLAEARVLNHYDAYYLDRNGEHPLPALLIRLNDPSHSQYYIDLKTAHIVEAYDDRSRWNRWLYHGLHSWNLPWLYDHRPAWDIFVLGLLLGGIALSITAVMLAFKVLRRAAGSHS